MHGTMLSYAIQSWANPDRIISKCFQSPASTAVRKGGPSEMNTDFNICHLSSPVVTCGHLSSHHLANVQMYSTWFTLRVQVDAEPGQLPAFQGLKWAMTLDVASEQRTSSTFWRIVINIFFNASSSAMFGLPFSLVSLYNLYKKCAFGVACPEHFTTEVAVLEPATGTVMDSPKQPHRRTLKESPTIYPTSLMPWRPWWPWRIRLRLVPLNNSTIEVETHSRLSVLGRQWSVLGVFQWNMLLVGQATCFQEYLCDTVACGSFCTAVLTNPTSADNSQHRSRKPAGIIQEVVAFVEKAPRGKSQNQTHPNTSKHLFQSFIIVYVLDPLVEDTCGISIPYA